MTNRRKLSGALVLCAAIAGCEKAPELPEPVSSAPIRVRVTPVRRGDIADVLTVTGETAALSVVRLASPVAGRVTFLAARAGDHVQAGAVTARVLPLENEAALHGFALLAGSSVLAADEQEAARQLRNGLRAADVAVRAPFSAVVAERARNPGEQVAQNDVLLELFDPQSFYVLAQVPVEAAVRVRPGIPVEITAGTRVTHGEVTALVTALTPQSLTAPLRISLSTALDPALLHEAVQCRITLAQHADALLVPRSALIAPVAQRAIVMVAADGRAAQREVQLGLRTSKEVEVLAGLTDGEAVLVEGQYSLPDGTTIEPVSTDEHG